VAERRVENGLSHIIAEDLDEIQVDQVDAVSEASQRSERPPRQQLIDETCSDQSQGSRKVTNWVELN